MQIDAAKVDVQSMQPKSSSYVVVLVVVLDCHGFFFFVLRTLRTLLLVGFRIKADPFLSPRQLVAEDSCGLLAPCSLPPARILSPSSSHRISLDQSAWSRSILRVRFHVIILLGGESASSGLRCFVVFFFIGMEPIGSLSPWHASVQPKLRGRRW